MGDSGLVRSPPLAHRHGADGAAARDRDAWVSVFHFPLTLPQNTRWIATFAIAALIVLWGVESIALGQVPSYEQIAKTASWGPSVHAFKLAIVPPGTPYKAGNEMNVAVLIRNNGPSLTIVPPAEYMFDTRLVNSGTETVVPSNRGSLDISGTPAMGVASGALIKITLDLRARYRNLATGTYRLTVSTNICEGSSFPARARPVYADIASAPIVITVLP